jgi:hypothetical protein
VKDKDMVIVNRIIHNFNRIFGAVKTDNAIFFGKLLYRNVVNPGLEGVANIRLTDPMPERRPGKLDDNIYTSSLPQKARFGKAVSPLRCQGQRI